MLTLSLNEDVLVLGNDGLVTLGTIKLIVDEEILISYGDSKEEWKERSKIWSLNSASDCDNSLNKFSNEKSCEDANDTPDLVPLSCTLRPIVVKFVDDFIDQLTFSSTSTSIECGAEEILDDDPNFERRRITFVSDVGRNNSIRMCNKRQRLPNHHQESSPLYIIRDIHVYRNCSQDNSDCPLLEDEEQDDETDPIKHPIKDTLAEPHLIESRRSKLNYAFSELTWNENHTRNQQETYCYCGQSGDWYRKMIQCRNCHQWFHQECLLSSPHLYSPMLLGDQFFRFTCALCFGEEGKEFLSRCEMKWSDALHLVLFNLTIVNKKKFHDVENSVITFFDRKCSSLKIIGRSLSSSHSKVDSDFIVKTLRCNKFSESSSSRSKFNFWSLNRVAPPSGPHSTTIMNSSNLTTSSISTSNSHKKKSEMCKKFRVHRKQRRLAGGSDDYTTSHNHYVNVKTKLNQIIPLLSNFDGSNNPFHVDIDDSPRDLDLNTLESERKTTSHFSRRKVFRKKTVYYPSYSQSLLTQASNHSVTRLCSSVSSSISTDYDDTCSITSSSSSSNTPSLSCLKMWDSTTTASISPLSSHMCILARRRPVTINSMKTEHGVQFDESSSSGVTNFLIETLY